MGSVVGNLVNDVMAAKYEDLYLFPALGIVLGGHFIST